MLSAKVIVVKLITKPTIIPMGLFFPLKVELARMTGSNGRTQGDKTVTMPAINAKKMLIAQQYSC